MAICWSASPSSAWSSFMGPALSRPTRRAQATLPRPLFAGANADGDDVNKEDSSSGFSLGNMFKGKGGESAAAASSPSLRGRGKALEAHPSVRPHISPLNRLGPDFDLSKVAEDSDPLPMHPDVKSGTLSNGFSYVILPNKSPPGRFEAHLQVFSGSCTYQEVMLVFAVIVFIMKPFNSVYDSLFNCSFIIFSLRLWVSLLLIC